MLKRKSRNYKGNLSHWYILNLKIIEYFDGHVELIYTSSWSRSVFLKTIFWGLPTGCSQIFKNKTAGEIRSFLMHRGNKAKVHSFVIHKRPTEWSRECHGEFLLCILFH